MAEPVSTTVTAVASFGLTALLAGWLGEIGADVMMVILSAIAGSIMALSSKRKTFFQSVTFIFLGVLTAGVLSWAISSAIVGQYPDLASPYLPTIVAFLLGFCVDKIPVIVDSTMNKIFNMGEK